ncbi:MAG: SoxR reducing system RseC family protein, partial [Bacteroidales bacterium]|nr:SoxR reducing system RseC family protein [Bacteroidales bacterium]
MMDKISHIGIVEEIKGQAVQVRIQQASACDLCHAKSICSSADTKEKFIEVKAPVGSVAVGDKVMVEGAASMG